MSNSQIVVKKTAAPARPDDAALPLDAVAAWVQQLARTLKTCRLYDGENPTVIKFRDETSRGLARLLTRGASLRLAFSATVVSFGDTAVNTARSRQDNLARPFFRDGISSITFSASVEPAEVDHFIERIVRVTSPIGADDDLVALLWEAEIPHLDIDYVAAVGEGDTEADGGAGSRRSSAALMPWPDAAASAANAAGPAKSASGPGAVASEDVMDRSDDWQTDVSAALVEPAFAHLQASAESEVARFRRGIEAESAEAPASAALRLIDDSLGVVETRDDRVELGRLLPRVIRDATRDAL